MSWLWVAVLLGLAWLVGAAFYYLSQQAHQPRNSPSLPRHPSVFVEMDDRPPMEIDFEAGIRAHSRGQNPSQEETR
ncbi:hypothetical protein [Meiothermus rufus]|uniref:hypothetical protein n=1 Tax=Meiothermus rufus TaxID=604332 RepID=UPI0004129783|nr:hypothetical protein [Meiothermus rufus]